MEGTLDGKPAKLQHRTKTMQLTTEILARFIGGQIEIQNASEGYLFRGEIETAEVDAENEMTIYLKWMAKAEGFPPTPTGWANSSDLTYQTSLRMYKVSNIGPGSEGDDRIRLFSQPIGETIVLYPPNGSRMDPAKVRGLNLSQQTAQATN